MFWITILFYIATIAYCNGDDDVESRIVTTKQGSIRGYKSAVGDFYVFYGVPYATAPTGPQRFQAPLPPPVWLDTFEAVKNNIVCPQFNYFNVIFGRNKQANENCLLANIYVPQTEDKELPVLVYVHGGGYILGMAEFAIPHQLANSKKVIIVNFNYRLGAHGFLCLGTKDAPGNAGMKDQVALLRWIKDNIARFGGNPDDVTIAGYSAGGASVDLLQLSKMANGLFNKVIPESGASMAMFSIQMDPIEVAKKHARQLNFNDVDDLNALENFYKTASYDLLTSLDVTVDFNGTFAPCVERDIGVDRFLEDSPFNILKSGNFEKRHMLFGFNKMEGILRVNLFEHWKDLMNSKFSDFLPQDLQFQSEDEKEEVAAKVKDFYFGTKLVGKDTIMGYIDYFTDIMFAYSTLLSIRLNVEAGNNEIYLYEYDYADESSPIVPYLGIHGVDHCSQTFAIHDGVNMTNNDESLASDNFKKMKTMTREIWLNFVTLGMPVPEGYSFPKWPPTGRNGSPYMVLDLVPELKESPLLEKRMRFWDDIYRKHYRQPLQPMTSQFLKTEL